MTTFSQAQTQAPAPAQAQAQAQSQNQAARQADAQAAQQSAREAAAQAFRVSAQDLRDQALALRNQAREQATLETQLAGEHQRRDREQKFTFAAFVIVVVAGFMILRPVARAFARRAEGTRPAPESLEMRETLQRMEHAIDAMAIEIERISENQRFTTKLLSDRAESKIPR